MGNTPYVFFRDSAGRAATRTDGKHAPTHLLAQMGESSILQEGDRIGWKGWPYGRNALFSSFMVLEPGEVELNDHDTRMIVWKALEEVAKKAPGRPLAASEVLKAGDIYASAFFRQPFNKYVLVTSLSVDRFPAKRVAVRSSVIGSLKARGKRYPLPKVLQSASHRNYFAEHLKSSLYQLIRIETQGRSVFEGVDRAFDDLSLLRALWSFGATRGQWKMRLGKGPRKPIGVIHTGPVHTLHNPDGSPANDNLYWFNPDYTGDLDVFKGDHQWQELEKDRRWAMKQIAGLRYGRELAQLFTRYVSALDQSNPNVAFLQLWGILEKLTDTVGGQYDETIKRTCWVYAKKSRAVMKETLESLRHHRNRYVHVGSSGQESEELTFLIKSFVDPHLVRLLNNTFKVESLHEYGKFLSYPTDSKMLEKMQTWSSLALRATREDDKEELDENAAASNT
jgi:hypothetical protein